MAREWTHSLTPGGIFVRQTSSRRVCKQEDELFGPAGNNIAGLTNLCPFCRSPIQCLNPLQLQKPGESCGLADAELGNVGDSGDDDNDEAKYQRALQRTFR